VVRAGRRDDASAAVDEEEEDARRVEEVNERAQEGAAVDDEDATAVEGRVATMLLHDARAGVLRRDAARLTLASRACWEARRRTERIVAEVGLCETQ
jgi:hypothetical protein